MSSEEGAKVLREFICYLERFVEAHKNTKIHLIDVTAHLDKIEDFQEALEATYSNKQPKDLNTHNT